MENQIRTVFFIRTGKKNVFYTLWSIREGSAVGIVREHYICNLSINEDEAEAKAIEYTEAYRQRVGESDSFKVVFGGIDAGDTYKRRGKLSIRDTHNIEAIEAGRFPFGKHAGTMIADAPASYLLFFADKAAEAQEPVMSALSAACLGVALEKGLIAKRDATRAAQREIDLVSQHVGTVGERLEFAATVACVIVKEASAFSDGYTMNKLRDAAGNLFICFGKVLGETGQAIKLRGTVTRHSERDGIKTTVINRPKVM